MKRLFFLLILISFQDSFAQWEKTAWQSESPVTIAARDGNRFLLLGSSDYSRTDAVKITADNGKNWTDITPKNLTGNVVNAQIIGNVVVLNSWNNGSILYVSANLGASWSDKFPGMTDDDSLIAYTYTNNTIIASFDGDKSGVYMFSDAGVTWEKISEGLADNKVQWFMEIGSSLFAYTGNRFYLFSHKDLNWVDKGEIDQFKSVVSYGETSNKIYILTQEGLFKSDDFGTTWTNIGQNLPNSFVPRRLTITRENIFLTSDNDPLSTTGENKIYSTTDDGATWLEKNNNLIKRRTYALYSHAEKLLLGVEDSLFVSSDEGKNWNFITKDLPHPSLGWYGLYFADSTIYHVMGNMIYISSDSGYTWNKWYGGINFSEVIDMVSMDDVLYAVQSGSPDVSSYNNAVFASDDFGLSWKPLNIKDKSILRLFAGDNQMLVTTQYDAFYSSDLGNTWDEVKHVWPENYFFDWAIFVPDKIFTCSYAIGPAVSYFKGKSFQYTTSGIPIPGYWVKDFQLVPGIGFYDILYIRLDTLLYISPRNGFVWYRIGESLPDMGFERSCMDVEFNEFYIYTKSAIYYSSDFGETWAERTGGLILGENKWVNTIKIIGDHAFISIVGDGVYVTADQGITWKKMNDGISNFYYINTFVDAGDYVFCGSGTGRVGPYGDAIYRVKKSDILSARDNIAQVPRELTIAPNPAGDFISITNCRGTDRRYTILNLLGQAVLSGELNGNGIFVSSLPAGAYVIRIGSQTGMMMKK